MAIDSPARGGQALDAAAQTDDRSGRERRTALQSTREYWLGDVPTESIDPDAPSDADGEGVAEHLANWSVAFVASLAASLSIFGGAWALGFLG